VLVLYTRMLLRLNHRLFAHLVCVLLIGALWGCGAAGDEHPAPVEYDDEQAQLTEPAGAALAEAGSAAGTCSPGVVRECRVMLSRQGDIENCFVGVQVCSDDAWGPCQNPDTL
jgi:hypothetical protein